LVPPTANESERDFFAEHGWLVVRGALRPGELAEVEQAFDYQFPPALFARARPGEVWQLLGAARRHPPIARWLEHPALGARAASLFGADRIQLLQDTLICKPPRVGGPIEWHQDYSYTGYLEPARSLSVRLSLTACSVDTGCLQVLDGSHLWQWRGRSTILSDDRVRDALDQLPPELAALVPSAQRTLELEPGDLSLHHCLTLHRSLPNVSPKPRKTIVAHVFDGACRLERTRLPPGAQENFVTDSDGHLSAAGFPVLFDSRL
jgi:phytanoyl-CoA hydroxylase